VVYFFQVNASALYGDAIEGILPSLMHPNEILDGALLNIRSNSHASYRYSSYFHQNHGVIQELYARHGRDLNFVGAIVYPAAADDIAKKELLAEWAVKQARLVGAQGACSSYAGGGHPCVEFMLICQKCERAGIRTVQVMPESYGSPEDPGFVYFVPEAVGIVSAGRSTQPVALPALPRVIGGRQFFDLPDTPTDSLNIPYRYVLGCCTPTGQGHLRAHQY
jgi:sarcosine reductase